MAGRVIEWSVPGSDVLHTIPEGAILRLADEDAGESMTVRFTDKGAACVTFGMAVFHAEGPRSEAQKKKSKVKESER